MYKIVTAITMSLNNASFNTDNLYFLNIFFLLYSSQLISESFVKQAGQLWGYNYY